MGTQRFNISIENKGKDVTIEADTHFGGCETAVKGLVSNLGSDYTIADEGSTAYVNGEKERVSSSQAAG